jgi:Tfp pilus assembly protein PilF
MLHTFVFLSGIVLQRKWSVSLFAGQFLLTQKRYTEAAAKLEHAIALSEAPEFEDVMTAATSLRLAGDFEGAENYYKLAISLRPQVSKQSRQ